MRHISFEKILCIPVVFFLSGIISQTVHAQLQTTPPDSAVLKGGTEEVLLDLIVRDKKGRPVRDLNSSEVEVTDNGQPQKIRSFRLVDGTEATSSKGKTQLDPMRQIRLVTLVFQGLDDNGRRLSRQAALDLLKNELGPNVFYAVFSIDNQLNALQAYTNDRDLLRKAVDRATSGLYTQFAGDSQRIRGQLETLVGPHGGQSISERIQDMAAETAGGHGAPSGNAINALQAQMVLNMLQFDENISNLQGGRATIFPLLALLRGQTLLPGRKTIVYFNQGLIVDPSLQSQFESVISTANRANVSIYPVDARGLQAGRNTQGGTDALAGALAASKSQNMSGGRGAVSPEQARAADRAEYSIRANAQNALRDLAESTGGFFISETNDFRAPLHRLNEDVNSYYELTYDPHIENYDGRLRKIVVKTARADLKVQTRSGYYALPPGENTTNVLPYEVPLLKALESKPLPRTFDYRASGLRFKPAANGMDCALVVEVPMKDITFTADAAGVQRARISLLALVKDASGNVVQKVTKDQPVQVTAEKLSGVRAGNFTSLEHFVLPSGRYTIESAVLDTYSNRVSARKSALVVPRVVPGVSVSSISIVRRFDPNSQDPQSPFYYQKGTITPTLIESMRGEKGAQMSVFFTIYPDPQITDKPKLTMEYLQEGKVVGRIQPELPEADPNGRIAYMASSPADQMPPGSYEVRALVQQGSTRAEEHTTFTIEPPASN